MTMLTVFQPVEVATLYAVQIRGCWFDFERRAVRSWFRRRTCTTESWSAANKAIAGMGSLGKFARIVEIV
jgi:hypothetical protein